MTRRHSITPTDDGRPLPPNPLWSYSPPTLQRLRDGREVVWVDAMTLANITEHNRAADARNGKNGGWSRG